MHSNRGEFLFGLETEFLLVDASSFRPILAKARLMTKYPHGAVAVKALQSGKAIAPTRRCRW